MLGILDRWFQQFQEYRRESRNTQRKPKKVYLQIEQLELRWLPTTVAFASSTYSVDEIDRQLSVTVNLSNSAPSSVSVQYATSDGTALNGAGKDYLATSGTLTFAQDPDTGGSVTTKTFTIPINWDDISESDETFTVTLSNPSTGLSLGSPSTTTVTIHDSSPTSWTASGQQRVVDGVQGARYPFGTFSVAVQDGDLSVSQRFDYGQGGAVFDQPALVYHSTSTAVRPVLEGSLAIPTLGASALTSVDAILTWNGTAQSAVTFTPAWPFQGYTLVHGLQVASTVTTSGTYSWSIQLIAHLDSAYGNIVRNVSGTALVVVSNGAFGQGWSIDGFNSLVAVSGGELMVYGGGGARLFTGTSGTYTNPANDYGTLVKNGDNTFTYTAKNQTKWNYDTSGNLTTIIDAHNLIRTFTYSGGNLSTVAEPDGGVTTFTYTSGKLASIVEPGNRTITITVDGSTNLTNIVDADGSLRTFSYDANHHLTNEKWGQFNATMTYDSTSGLLTNIDRGASNTLGITSAVQESLSVSPTAKTSNQNTIFNLATFSNLTLTLDQPGRLISFQGSTSGQGGGEGGSTSSVIVRDNAGNITVFTDALNRTTTLTYNSSGDLTRITWPDSSMDTFTYDSTFHKMLIHQDTRSHITTYTYNTYGDLLTVKDPLNNVTSYAWSSGLLQTVQDANNHTTTYSYDSDRRVQTIKDALNNVTTYGYDSAGNIQVVTDALGRVTTFSYDAKHRQLTKTDALGGIITQTYNAQSQITSVTDQLSRTTSYVYSAQGWLSTKTDAVGTSLARTTTFSYYAVGYLATITDALSHTTTYTYTIFGDEASVTDPLGHTTTYSYDDARQLISVSNPLSETTTFSYDVNGWVTSVQNALHNFTTCTYDTEGNVLTITDSNNGVTTLTYDARNKLIASTDPLNHTTTTVYDAVGNKQVIIDALGNCTTYSYDPLNRLQTVKDALSNVNTYVYDAVGNLINLVDALSNRVTFAYDSLNRRINTIDANSSKTTFVYDAASQLVNLIDPDSNKTTFVYDALGRQTQEIDALGKIITYTYNAVNLLTQKKDRLSQTIDYSYDAANRLVGEVWKISGGTTTNTVTYTYDNASQLLTVGDSQGYYTFTYDDIGELKTQKDMWGNTLTFTFDSVGNRTNVQDNFGGLETSTYDAANNLTARKFSGIGGSSMRSEFSYTATNELRNIKRYNASTGGSLIGQTTYTYDNDLRMSGIQNADGSGNSLSLYTYTYDNAGRLSTEQLGGSSTTYSYDAAGQLTNDGVNTYAYDAAGNRNNSGQVIGSANRLTSDNNWNYTYDDEGNLTQKVSVGGPTVTWTYYYDVKHRLTSVHETAGGSEIFSATYSYDAFDDRIQTQVDGDGVGPGAAATTRYAWEGGKVNQGAWQNRRNFVGTENRDVWADEDGSNNLKVRYIHGNAVDQLFARVKSDGTVAWYLADRLGSVRQMVDASGALKDVIAYDGFGKVISESDGNFGDRYKWTGREFDGITGLLYDRSRFLLTQTGLWSTEDPIRYQGHDYNLRAYIHNSPTMGLDASGERGITGGALGGSLVGIVTGAFVGLGIATLITITGALVSIFVPVTIPVWLGAWALVAVGMAFGGFQGSITGGNVGLPANNDWQGFLAALNSQQVATDSAYAATLGVGTYIFLRGLRAAALNH